MANDFFAFETDLMQMSSNEEQRDATILDDEIAGLMRESTSHLFDKFRPGIVELLAPEVNALIRTFIFTCSTFVHMPTPGMKLQNVQFCQSAFRGRNLFVCYVLSIALPYMWKRSTYFITAQKARNRRHEASYPRKSSWQSEDFVALMKRLETMVSICQFLNLLIFLRNGCFRSLEERLLGMKLKALDEQSCLMNYEPITRQHLWQTFTDLGSTFLPVLVYCYRRIANKLQKKHKLSLTTSGDCCLLCRSPPLVTLQPMLNNDLKFQAPSDAVYNIVQPRVLLLLSPSQCFGRRKFCLFGMWQPLSIVQAVDHLAIKGRINWAGN